MVDGTNSFLEYKFIMQPASAGFFIPGIHEPTHKPNKNACRDGGGTS